MPVYPRAHSDYGKLHLPFSARRNVPSRFALVLALLMPWGTAMAQETGAWRSQDAGSIPSLMLVRVTGDDVTEEPLEMNHLLRMYRPGLEEPVAYVLAWQVIGMAWLLSLDREATGFEHPSINNVARAFTRAPVWDEDRWYTNYLGHPLWGSETYLATRRNGYGRFEAFLFSTANSIAWEYAIEGWAEQPSIQDLLVTSTVGSILGELRYAALISLNGRNTAAARVLVHLADPLRSVSNSVGFRISMGIGVTGHP
jgi:hypothetical protein